MKPWNDRMLVSTVTEAVNRYRLVRSLRAGDELTLRSLAHAIELKDPYTRGHSDRVAEYALMIADTFNLPDDLKRVIKFGSIIHDCGKIGVPENILNKRSSLSIEEYDIIKNHPRWGADVALQANLDPRVVNIILHHHEKYDGSGYPAGLKGDEIPLEVQIVTAADVYDALTSDRCYRKRYSDEKAARIMLEMKNVIFDPQVIDRFIHQCIGCSDKHFTGPGTAKIIP
jgi:putative nucleotidyltransferase with HDIG domain